jgi:hypothetical protein
LHFLLEHLHAIRRFSDLYENDMSNHYTFISSVCLQYFEFHVNWSNVNDHLISKCKINSWNVLTL